MDKQLCMFEMLEEPKKLYKITKPIRLISFFSGYESQLFSLKYLCANVESWKTCEWAVKSIQALKDGHFSNDNTDYSKDLSKQELIDYLFKKGVSANYNEPMTYEQIKRLGEDKLRTIYNNIQASHNLVNIQQVHAEDLGIVDTDKYDYVTTYSFPCFPGQSLVLTNSGYKCIKDVKVGEYVLTHDNTYKKVINSKLTGKNRELLGVDCVGSKEISCTPEHLFLTRKNIIKNRKINGVRHNVHFLTESSWKKASELVKGDLLGFPINTNAIIPTWSGYVWKNRRWKNFKKKDRLASMMDNLDFWWLVGRYVGDGWVVGNSVVISVAKDEKREVVPVLERLNFKYTIHELERPAQKFFISQVELVSFLNQFGKGAHGKFIPGFVIDMPIEYIKSFLTGYFSADGSISVTGNRRRQCFSTVSKQLVFGLQQLILKAYKRPLYVSKVQHKLPYIDGKLIHSGEIYNCSFSLKDPVHKTYFYEDNMLWCVVKSINSLNTKEDVYDLTIQDNHSFVVQGVCVHNCQDLSLAGKLKGLSKGSGTRSSLIWEIERILEDCKELNTLPQVLVMENVSQVHSKKNMLDFQMWLDKLKELGYSNYYQDLNAKDYGIPQNRKRTFMVSILGDYDYKFPQPIKLEKRLKDLLESNVDEKYYLSDKMCQYIVKSNEKYLGNNNHSFINKEVGSCITTREGNTRCDSSNYIAPSLPENTDIKLMELTKNQMQGYRVYDTNGLSTSLIASAGGVGAKTGLYLDSNSIVKDKNGNTFITKGTKQLDETIQNNELEDGSMLDLYNRSVHNDIAQTIDTGYHNSQRVCVKDNETFVTAKYKNFIDKEQRVPEMFNPYNEQEIKDIAPTQTTQCGGFGSSASVLVKEEQPKVIGGIGEKKSNNSTQWYQQDRIYDDKVAISVTTAFNPFYKRNLRIGKLTPRECGRLQGLKDEDIDKIQQNQSNASCYHLYGDSICVPVLMAIFSKLIDKDYKDYLDFDTWWGDK